MHTDGPRLLILLLHFFILHGTSWSQNFVTGPWQQSFSPITTFHLDQQSLDEVLSRTVSRWEKRSSEPGVLISIPQPGGSNSTYEIWRSEQMAPVLAAAFPRIQTFFGQSADDHRQLVYFIRSAAGVKILYFNESGMTSRLEPLQANLPVYHFSMRSDWGIAPDLAKACQALTDEEDLRWQHLETGEERRGETKFYRYRLALACTGEYGSYHGDTKEEVLAAMNELLLQVNAIYEREFSIHFDLVANNEQLIFLDPATDPYDNFEVESLLEANKMVCNYSIGYAKFDIGHVLTTKFGGQAHIGSACNYSRKAKAFSGLETPEGYYMGTIFAHEIGHQIGAQHTQSNNCNRNPNTAFEPGSGSTIMAYAGLCTPNVQNLPDDYFHGNSVELIAKKTAQGFIFGCAPGEKTDNFPPVADAGPDLYVPIGTAFQLKGSGSDPDGDSLSYLWEQMDVLAKTDSTNLYGPAFRSFPPSTSPLRSIGATDQIWEVLPNHARSATFRLTVRDHHFGLGSTAFDEMTVHFIDAAGPLQVLRPNAAKIRWEAGSKQTVKWDKAGTDETPLSCAVVSIYLSKDGGLHYDMLAENVPNNGSAKIDVPDLTGRQFRIKVSGNNGSFFDVSDHNFEIFVNSIEVPVATVVHDTTTVNVDTTLATDTDTMMVPQPDTTEIPVMDTISLPETDTITTPVVDTTLIASADMIPALPIDTIVIPPVDTVSIGTISGVPPILENNTDCKTCFPSIDIAPNPSSGTFYLHLSLPKPEPGRFYLFNSQGQLLQQRRRSLETGRQHLQWDLSAYPNGMYWLRILVGERQWAKAVVLER